MRQLMTCVRPAEAAGARWEEIDLERQQWLISANRMKGGLNEHIGKAAANTLMKILQGSKASQDTIVPTQLLVRSSCCAPSK
ncbi:hypothetical protein [Agarivorans aestuarii]|uniref:hypothetical protein n=1 Tax=Agarivorans aestuarii TaxID=1563703 RepID=UPI001C7F5C93|nr:hypothetical protein [Agarivorans aestuarii]